MKQSAPSPRKGKKGPSIPKNSASLSFPWSSIAPTAIFLKIRRLYDAVVASRHRRLSASLVIYLASLVPRVYPTTSISARKRRRDPSARRTQRANEPRKWKLEVEIHGTEVVLSDGESFAPRFEQRAVNQG